MRSLLILLVMAASVGSCTAASPINYQKMKVGRTWAHVVTVNMTDPNVKVTAGIARRGRGSSESFSSMVARTAPKAAITGTFFDTRSLLPIGDIAIDGQMVHSGYFKTALCITPANRARVLSRPRGGWKDMGGVDTLMCGGITLIRGGRITLAPKAEGFRDRALFRPNRRTAIGITGSGKLLMVGVTRAIYLKDLAHVMIKLGAIDALALDGGSSTAMYYGGRSITRPARKLTNLLLAYDTTRGYEQAKCQLAPTIFARTPGHPGGAPRPIVMARAPFNEGPFLSRPFNASMMLLAADTRTSAPLVHEPEIRSSSDW